ncbi:MAG: UDP-N-acetylglucosamine--N-acetylmuramyl-(pentapeptide) pyrophosphoryl-undecaprenol N-acetylglucosamine transferase, partial [Anaerolineae bacterium]
VVIDDAELDSRLVGEVRALLSDGQRLAAMATAMGAISVPDAADRLAQCILDVAQGGQRD